jgi:hypothetical protein
MYWANRTPVVPDQEVEHLALGPLLEGPYRKPVGNYK